MPVRTIAAPGTSVLSEFSRLTMFNRRCWCRSATNASPDAAAVSTGAKSRAGREGASHSPCLSLADLLLQQIVRETHSTISMATSTEKDDYVVVN